MLVYVCLVFCLILEGWCFILGEVKFDLWFFLFFDSKLRCIWDLKWCLLYCFILLCLKGIIEIMWLCWNCGMLVRIRVFWNIGVLKFLVCRGFLLSFKFKFCRVVVWCIFRKYLCYFFLEKLFGGYFGKKSIVLNWKNNFMLFRNVIILVLDINWYRNFMINVWK